MKIKKPNMKFHLYEKSFRKCEFLSSVKEKLDLNAEVFQKDKVNFEELEKYIQVRAIIEIKNRNGHLKSVMEK